MIIDLPFPSVDPTASFETVHGLAMQLCSQIEEQFGVANDPTLHISGEYTLTYEIVHMMESRGIPCVTATTRRVVLEQPDGLRNYKFEFVAFRRYFEATFKEKEVL